MLVYNTSFLKYQDKDITKLSYYEKFDKTTYDNKIESGFYGYNDINSFVPQDNLSIPEGRVNPTYIKYLYTAEDPYTALVEIRPYLNSVVSIANIEISEELKVVDFSFDSLTGLEDIKEILMYFIMLDFSKPSESSSVNYIPTQFVAEFIKNLGFDGVKFTSSLNKQGRNITVFNYNKCRAIGSELYNINDIGYKANQLFPENEVSLMHNKFLIY